MTDISDAYEKHNPSAGAVGHSADSARGAGQSSSAEGPERDNQGPVAPIDYNGIAGRMEVIQPKDVSLVKYLGSGGYGEVYLGKWHSSEAAIKCLNPSLFFNAGQVDPLFQPPKATEKGEEIFLLKITCIEMPSSLYPKVP